MISYYCYIVVANSTTIKQYCDDAVKKKHGEVKLYAEHNCATINSDEVMVEPVHNQNWEICFFTDPALVK